MTFIDFVMNVCLPTLSRVLLHPYTTAFMAGVLVTRALSLYEEWLVRSLPAHAPLAQSLLAGSQSSLAGKLAAESKKSVDDIVRAWARSEEEPAADIDAPPRPRFEGFYPEPDENRHSERREEEAAEEEEEELPCPCSTCQEIARALCRLQARSEEIAREVARARNEERYPEPEENRHSERREEEAAEEEEEEEEENRYSERGEDEENENDGVPEGVRFTLSRIALWCIRYEEIHSVPVPEAYIRIFARDALRHIRNGALFSDPRDEDYYTVRAVEEVTRMLTMHRLRVSQYSSHVAP